MAAARPFVDFARIRVNTFGGGAIAAVLRAKRQSHESRYVDFIQVIPTYNVADPLQSQRQMFHVDAFATTPTGSTSRDPLVFLLLT